MAKVGCVDVGAIFNAVGVIKISWFSFKKAWLWYKGTWKKIHWKLRHHLVNVSTVVMSFRICILKSSKSYLPMRVGECYFLFSVFQQQNNTLIIWSWENITVAWQIVLILLGNLDDLEKLLPCTNCHQIHPWRERGLSL